MKVIGILGHMKLEPRSTNYAFMRWLKTLVDLGSSWGRRNNRKSALTWPKKLKKEKSSKLQAASLTAGPRDDRIQLERIYYGNKTIKKNRGYLS